MIASIVFACLLAGAYSHEFSDCGGSTIKVNWQSIKVPDPIRLQSGRREAIAVSANILKDLPDRIKISLKVEKKILWGYVTVPCVSQLGSCTYDLPCNNPLISQLGIHCPVKAGAVKLDQVITLPNISVPSFLASGKYKLNAKIRNYYTGEMLGCGNAQLNIST